MGTDEYDRSMKAELNEVQWRHYLGTVQKQLPILSLGFNGVIPFRQNRMLFEIQSGHLFIGDLDLGGVGFVSEGGMDRQPFFGRGASQQCEHLVITA